MSKQFWAVIVVVFVIFGGIFAISNKNSETKTSNSAKNGTLSQHVEGTSPLGITLVEYGDYECPYCGQYYATVKQVQAEYKDQVVFQFRNFPLVSVHRNAFAGARAAEAAALQNKFWEMHDILYQNQDTWSAATDPNSYFDQYAKALGLNVATFDKDYASSKVNDTINADTAEGNKLGIQGTPTFYLNGKQEGVGNSVAAFEKIINAAIAAKQKSATAATPSSTDATTQTKGSN